MAIYRGFDQETLNREYRIRDTVSSEVFDAAVGRYRAESDRMRDSLVGQLDQPFGPSADEIIDIFPVGNNAPLFLFIHGGYWRGLSHRESSFMAENFATAGIGVAAVNYSLAPAASLDEIVRQCRAAIGWLYANATEIGFDRDRIYVSGSSAGGHLVGMMLAGGWHEEFGVPMDVVRGACALSGLHDLEPIRLAEPNEWLDLDAKAARRNSPIHQLPDQGGPLIVSYGGNETAEFKRQTDDFATAWQGRGFACQSIARDACNHFDLPLEFLDPVSPLTQAVFEQING